MEDDPNLTRAAVRTLTTAGWSATAIAEALGVTSSLVWRYRAEMREDALKVVRDCGELAKERAG